jgi:hypothetical protein
MRGHILHGIPIIIRSVTALPRSMDIVFWSGRRYILGSLARPTRVGLVSAWAVMVATTPRALSLSHLSPYGSEGELYRCRLREELAQLREKIPRDTVVVGGD